MPSTLRRFQETRTNLHFVTFSCYQRLPLLGTADARSEFLQTVEEVRRWYDFELRAYVAMPEHVHVLMSEPLRKSLAVVIQMLKQNVARKLSHKGGSRFWLPRYYDFNVRTSEKMVEKIRYIHRNPVIRGLVSVPAEWRWSSYRYYVFGEESPVRIESEWLSDWRARNDSHPPLKRKGGAPEL